MTEFSANNTTPIETQSIQPPLFQCRLTSLEDGLEELTESIKTYGILQPLTVRYNTNNQPELVFGSRRLAASKLAGLKTVPVIVKELTDEQALEIESIENLNRTDLTENEKTHLVSEWARRGYNAEEISKKVHRTSRWVLLYLPSEFKNPVKVEAGKIGAVVSHGLRQNSAEMVSAHCQDLRNKFTPLLLDTTTKQKPKVACPKCGAECDSELDYRLFHWKKNHYGPPAPLEKVESVNISDTVKSSSLPIGRLAPCVAPDFPSATPEHEGQQGTPISSQIEEQSSSPNEELLKQGYQTGATEDIEIVNQPYAGETYTPKEVAELMEYSKRKCEAQTPRGNDTKNLTSKTTLQGNLGKYTYEGYYIQKPEGPTYLNNVLKAYEGKNCLITIEEQQL